MVKAKKRTVKATEIIRLLLVLAILVIINIISNYLYTRFDLTAEKRYSLSKESIRLLKELDSEIFLKVYLEGDFPPAFKKLSNSTKDLLQEMKRESGGNLDFEFVNPSDNIDEKTTQSVYRQLYEKGLLPTDLQTRNDEGMSQKVVWPGALVFYKDKEVPLNFLKTQLPGMTPQQVINASEEGLEYEIINALRILTLQNKPTIAFIKGQRELSGPQLKDFRAGLSKSYNIEDYDIKSIETIPQRFNAIIIVKPDSVFSDWAQFKIDNYLMHGGKILWMIDAVSAEMDSMQGQLSFLAPAKDLNLEAQLFRYGVRVNPFLVQDLSAARIPIVTGNLGDRPQQNLFPWFYHPLVISKSMHPIAKNVDPILLKFANTIDTINNGIKKEILLTTSQFTKVLFAPVRVNLGLIKDEPNPQSFNKPNQPLAVLLEGEFESIYKNRLLNDFAKNALDSLGVKMKDKSVSTSMIVIADGDIGSNLVKSDGSTMPLGFDPYSNITFGNKTFLLNCVDYLLDDSGLMNVRAKEITLRLLDKQKVKTDANKWKVINVGVPIASLLLFGLIFNLIRRRKFAK